MVSFVYRAWRRVLREVGELELWEVLKRRGTRAVANGNRQALLFAVDRCASCAAHEPCARLLAAGHDDKIEAFCPNAMYLRHLDAMRRHWRKRSPPGPDT